MIKLDWRKSRYSEAQSACVEVAFSLKETAHLRDSKNAKAGFVSVPRSSLAALVAAVKDDTLDLN